MRQMKNPRLTDWIYTGLTNPSDAYTLPVQENGR